MNVYRVTITKYPKDGPSDEWRSPVATWSTKQAALAAIAEAYHKARPAIAYKMIEGDKHSIISPLPWDPVTYDIETLEVKE